jgi:hypothetical protein
MAVIDSIDGVNRRIYLSASTQGNDVHPIDIYKEMRALRKTDESLRKYKVFLKAFGNVDKGGGKATERYVRCEHGTKIVPYDDSHVITVTGTIITDDGQEGVDCFDKSGLSPTTSIDINYIPPQVEVITISSGSGLSVEQAAELQSVYLSLLGRRVQDIASGEVTIYDQDNITPRHVNQSYKNGIPSTLYDADEIAPKESP